jgi:APA family basic amino acid/polyamine antiporter
VGGAAAALGALLALVAGIGRTVLAMAREADLPRPLAAVHPRHRTPHRAEVGVAVVVCVLVLAVDLRGAIGFSSFGVLVYYLIANLSAFTQAAPRRRFPRRLQVVGAVGCLLLAATLPGRSVLAGTSVFALGLGYRALRLARARRAGIN